MVGRSSRDAGSVMSTSTKSKSASHSSPAGGPETESALPEAKARGPIETVEVELEASRQRVISWTIFGILFGALLVLKLGTVGVWAGWILIALGAFRGYQLAMTLVHP